MDNIRDEKWLKASVVGRIKEIPWTVTFYTDTCRKEHKRSDIIVVSLVSLTFLSLHHCISSPALLKLLDVVLPCFMATVRTEPERQVVMGILETMNNVIKTCKEEVFRNPAYLKEVSSLIHDVLKKKVRTGEKNGLTCYTWNFNSVEVVLVSLMLFLLVLAV